MDFSVILMLVIMVACAIALIGFSNKEAKRKDEPELPPVPEDGPGLKGDPGPKPEPEPVGEPDPGPAKGKKLEIDPGPPVISIYSCEAKRGAKICPYCDGENTEDARTCQICRQDI